MVTTVKRSPVYSPASDSARKNGRKAAAVVRDAMRRGVLSSLAESTAAARRSFPDCICTMMDSDMTIALSTNIPNATMSEASDIWFSPIPKSGMRNTDITMATGISAATTRPVRTPRVSSMTSTTMPTACSTFQTKSLTLCSTTSDCIEMMSRSIPMG